VLSSPVTATVDNDGDSLSVFDDASPDGVAIAALDDESQLTVTGYTIDGWLQISADGISQGYVPESGVDVPVVSVAMAKGAVTVDAGSVTATEYAIFPACATNQDVSWSSSQEAVATVDETGNVTAITAGSTSVTVTTVDGGMTDSTTYTVSSATPPPTPTPSAQTTVTVSPSSPAVMSGRKTTLKATVKPTAKKVTWSSAKTATATVTQAGVVTGKVRGKGKSVAVTITAKIASGVKGTSKVMVYTVQDVQVRLNALKCLGANKKVLAVDGQFGPNSKAATASFQKTVMLSQTSSPSSATLKAMFASTAPKCGTKPGVPPTSIAISPASISIMSSKTSSLVVTFVPSNATASVTWTSDKTTTATVSATGVVTGKVTGLGNSAIATITAKTVTGGLKSTAQVHVYTVQDVQTRLNTLGCTDANKKALVVDGKFGASSVTALTNWQLSAGRTPSGSPDRNTIAALFADTAPQCGALPPSTLVITGGMTIKNPLPLWQGVTVKGTVTSLTKITKLTASIVASNSKSAFSCSATPNALKYNLSACDNALKFSSLIPGTYKYVIKATNGIESNTVVQTQSFTVKASQTGWCTAFSTAITANDQYPVPAAHKGKGTVADFVAIAKSQAGYVEGTYVPWATCVWFPTTSNTGNWSKYGYSLGMGNGNGGWCAAFVTWSARQAGLSTNVVPNYTYVPTGKAWYVSHKDSAGKSRFHSNDGKYVPKPGDIIFYYSGGSWYHTGLVVSYDSSTRKLTTMEGNHSDKAGLVTQSLSSPSIGGFGSNS